MSVSHKDRIVVRRKKSGHDAHHGGSWKIAYADFMTAMMAFFLVMWILSLVPKHELKEIADYFRMPLVEAISGGQKAEHSSSIIPGGHPSVIPHPNSGTNLGESQRHREDVERLEDLKSALEELIRVDPMLREFRPQLLLDMTQDGLRIQIIDRQNRPMFATGSAQVQSYMRAILRSLSMPLNEMPNRLQISGHTDSMQYASGDRLYSNWELSADRANAARQELVAGGLAEDKVKRVLGLADSVTLIKDKPEAAVNRRISLLVLSSQAERRIDEQNASDLREFDLREAMQEPAGPIDVRIPGLPELPPAVPASP